MLSISCIKRDVIKTTSRCTSPKSGSLPNIQMITSAHKDVGLFTVRGEETSATTMEISVKTSEN